MKIARILAPMVAGAAAAATSLAMIAPSASAAAQRRDTIGVMCTYLNGNLCIATQGTGNQVKIQNSGATLIDFQPATGTSEYKLKVYNSTHCLTYRTSDNAVISADCVAGDGNQKFHESDNGVRATYSICGSQCIYLGNFDPPADGKLVWMHPATSDFDSGWVANF